MSRTELTTRRESSTIHPFRVVQRWPGRTHTTEADIRARHCGYEAQVEVTINTTKNGSDRTAYASHSLVLTPELARELALVLCPELGDSLRAAAAYVELNTGNGTREQPPAWAVDADGSFNAERIAARCRKALAT